MLEGIIKFLQVFNFNFSVTEKYFKDELNSYIEEAEIYANVTIPSSLKSLLSCSIYNEYKKGTIRFGVFRGDLVEYLVVLLEKNKISKIYHEPKIRHKNKELIKKKFIGKNCLVDVVKVQSKGQLIKFIECKAQLDTHIKSLRKSNSTFQKKINYMNHIDKIIRTYTYDNNNFTKTEKIFATISDPKRALPSQFSDFKVINLLNLLEDKIDNGKFRLY